MWSVRRWSPCVQVSVVVCLVWPMDSVWLASVEAEPFWFVWFGACESLSRCLCRCPSPLPHRLYVSVALCRCGWRRFWPSHSILPLLVRRCRCRCRTIVNCPPLPPPPSPPPSPPSTAHVTSKTGAPMAVPIGRTLTPSTAVDTDAVDSCRQSHHNRRCHHHCRCCQRRHRRHPRPEHRR